MYYVNEDVGKWALINGYTNWYKPLCKKFEKINQIWKFYISCYSYLLPFNRVSLNLVAYPFTIILLG